VVEQALVVLVAMPLVQRLEPAQLPMAEVAVPDNPVLRTMVSMVTIMVVVVVVLMLQTIQIIQAEAEQVDWLL
jgi:hypothetical protein